VLEMIDDVDRLVDRVKAARLNKEVTRQDYYYYFFPSLFYIKKKKKSKRYKIETSYVIDDQSTE
jgi:hypothetical protein